MHFVNSGEQYKKAASDGGFFILFSRCSLSFIYFATTLTSWKFTTDFESQVRAPTEPAV